MIRALAALAAAAAATLPASSVLAAPARPDPRIRTVDYDPARVVRLAGVVRTATQVRFGPDETIQHVAVGDAAAWEVAAEGSVLFLKPTGVRPPTNLIATTTTPAGETRHYAFELSARASAARGAPAVYVLRFRYPEEDARRLTGRAAAEAQALQQRLLQLKLERGAVEGRRNLAYALQGDAGIAPSEVSDNGRFTVLRFPGTQAIPSVHAVGPDGREALVAFDVRGEFLVVHQTAAQLRLRRRRQILCVFNLAWSPAGPRPATATATPAVVRSLKEDRR